jgi:Tfp pilus assembly protein PilN
MIRINLLPEEFHVRRKKIRIAPGLGYIAAVVVGLFLIMALLTVWQRSRIGHLDRQIEQVQMEAERQRADLALVERLTELKNKILQRMQAVEKLNRNRTRWIDILTDLSTSIPGDLWLVSFKEEATANGEGARIQGMTFSLKPIALLMDNLEDRKWFLDPQFTYARRIPVPDGMAYDFEILSDLYSYDQPAASSDTSGSGDQPEGQ